MSNRSLRSRNDYSTKFQAECFHLAADETNDTADQDELHAAAVVVTWFDASGDAYVQRWLDELWVRFVGR